MRRQTMLPLTLGSLCLILGGCGTVLNTAYFCPDEGRNSIYGGGKSVYGGVLMEASLIRDALDPTDDRDVRGVLFALDLPFSLVGDTVTLPYTLWWQWHGYPETPGFLGAGPHEAGTSSPREAPSAGSSALTPAIQTRQ